MRAIAAWLPAVMVALALGSCAAPTEQVLRGRTMGSDWSVKVAGPIASTPAQLEAGVQAQFERVDAQMSSYRAQSALMRFNRSPAGQWQQLPPELLTVLGKALELAAATDGVYDPTLGPLVALWGFGPGGRVHAAPAPAQIAEARARTGWRRIELDPPGGRARHEEGVTIDLASLAKGYGVDLVAAYLDGAGVGNYLIDLSGKMRARGHNAMARPWRVAVEQPGSDDERTGLGRPTQTVLALPDVAVASAGDYRHFFAADGAQYSHILDPRTGRPVAHGLAGVTMVASDCLTADAWVTALLALGPTAGYELAQAQGFAALFMQRQPDDTFQLRTTAAFARFIAPL